jgi:hypothetical protein
MGVPVASMNAALALRDVTYARSKAAGWKPRQHCASEGSSPLLLGLLAGALAGLVLALPSLKAAACSVTTCCWLACAVGDGCCVC